MISVVRTRLDYNNGDNPHPLYVDRVYNHILDIKVDGHGTIPLHRTVELRVFNDCNDSALIRALKELIEYVEEHRPDKGFQF